MFILPAVDFSHDHFSTKVSRQSVPQHTVYSCPGAVNHGAIFAARSSDSIGIVTGAMSFVLKWIQDDTVDISVGYLSGKEKRTDQRGKRNAHDDRASQEIKKTKIPLRRVYIFFFLFLCRSESVTNRYPHSFLSSNPKLSFHLSDSLLLLLLLPLLPLLLLYYCYCFYCYCYCCIVFCQRFDHHIISDTTRESLAWPVLALFLIDSVFYF